MLISCTPETNTASVSYSDTILQLKDLLHTAENNPEEQAVIIDQLMQEYRKNGLASEIPHLLTAFVSTHPNTSYNAYFLYLTAEYLRQSNDNASAVLYYYRAVYRHPDVEVQGESVHYRSLNMLIQLSSSPEEQLQYYDTLQSRFAGRIDPGIHHYFKAKIYEKVGDYEAAFREYRNFISYPDTRIPGQPNAYQQVQKLLAFQSSARDWTYENLDDLVSEIQTAIATRNHTRLVRSRAKVNFFAMSWKQDEADPNATAGFEIGPFLTRNRIRFAAELEPRSTAQEAYLWTSGWEPRIPTWYLYFRKIDFPADPKVHGNWEWAGIYFGELL